MEMIPPISTSPQTASRSMHDGNSTIRLIVKLLREVVTRQRFTEYSDVKDALRRKLSALRIRYQQREFDDAYPIVASNLPLVRLPAKPVVMVERLEENRSLSRYDAAEAMAQIRQRLGVSPSLPSMPPGRRRTVRQADRVKAAQMVASEIVASVERCEALEREQ